MRVFPVSISSWFLIGVWVRASPFKSPWLFSSSWPILIILYSGMVFIRPLISVSFRPSTNHLEIVLSAPFITSIIVTFMFIVVLTLYQGQDIYPSVLLHLILICCLQGRNIPLFDILSLQMFGCQANIRWFVCISNFRRTLYLILQERFRVELIALVR